MTLEAIARRLDAIQADVAGIRTEMREGFNAARIRDEEQRDLMKFGLEAREALRESVDERFAAADKKQDEQIGLLKNVLRSSRF